MALALEAIHVARDLQARHGGFGAIQYEGPAPAPIIPPRSFRLQLALPLRQPDPIMSVPHSNRDDATSSTAPLPHELPRK